MGDAHTAQGNSELDGTGIETSINGNFRVTLHKADSLPLIVQNLTFPLLENDNEYVIHGFNYAVWALPLLVMYWPDPAHEHAKMSLISIVTAVSAHATLAVHACIY